MQEVFIQRTDDVYNGTRRQDVSFEEYEEQKRYGLLHANLIPNAEVQNVIDKCSNYTSEQIKNVLAINRSCNRICNGFGEYCKNGTRDNLIVCEHCKLTWYCSEACQQKQQKKHALWCREHIGCDNGPLRASFCTLQQLPPKK